MKIINGYEYGSLKITKMVINDLKYGALKSWKIL